MVRVGDAYLSDEKKTAVCDLTKLEQTGQNQYVFHYEISDKDDGWTDFGTFNASLDAVHTFLMMEAMSGNTTIEVLEGTLTPYHPYNCRTGHENNRFTVHYREYDRVRRTRESPTEVEPLGAEVVDCLPVRNEYSHRPLTDEVTKAMESFFRGWNA